MNTPPPLRPISLVRELRYIGADDRPFRHAVRAGDAIRIHRGAYMSAEDWRALDREGKHLHQAVAAATAGRSRPTLSHHSAAVLWGIPLLPPLPKIVHVLSTPATGTRSEGGYRRHATSKPDVGVCEIHGVATTDLERTLVEFVGQVPFADAVAALDWALRPATSRDRKPWTSSDRILEMADRLDVVKGRRRLTRALDFADPRSGSPGESLSRTVIHEAGIPAPELQTEFRDRQGLIGYVDFYWPDFGLIGEFDGIGKYLREDTLNGRTTAEAVIAEKKREDRLRACGPGVTRWGWLEARAARLLAVQLSDSGLPWTGR